ncbi:MAG TPA: Ig-like domain-containing protein, partial [Pseudomonadota bacterium]|nr:Ig-like domain-containing protein [Pseudomonadota bacterium]
MAGFPRPLIQGAVFPSPSASARALMNVRAASEWGRLAVLLCALGAIAGPVGPASAAGEDSTLLHIRARSRLQLRQSEAQGRKGKFTVGIEVELSDQPLASPGAESPNPEDLRWFASQRIELSLSGTAGLLQRVTVTTGRQGSATYSFARLPAGLYRVHAQYPGDEHRDAASEELDLHLDRFRSELSFNAPPTWGGDRALSIRDLALRGKHGALPGPIKLSAFLSRDGKASGAALVQRPVQLALPPEGGPGPTSSIELSVPPVPPGSVLLVRAVYDGDDDNAPAQLERELIVVTQAQVTLDAGPREAAQSAPLRISGTLFTTGTVGSGPLPGELVDIEANQAPELPDNTSLPGGSEGATAPPSGGTIRRAPGTAVSNADGRFVLDIP